jgi:lipopolysaccharide export system protein LptA
MNSRPMPPAIAGISLPFGFASILVLALVVCAPAHAEKADRDKPINFQGDSGAGNADTKTGELAGNVVVTQGTLTIHADRIAFKQNADNSLSATAYGNPVSFREKRDGVDEYYEGFAQRIVYDGTKRFVELFDRALLKKSNGEVRSNYISYNAETEKFDAQGRPDSRPAAEGELPLGSRVRGMFQPDPKETKETKDGKDSKGAPDAKGEKTPPPEPKASPPLPLKSDPTLRAPSSQ